MQSKTSSFSLPLFKRNLRRTAAVGVVYFLFYLFSMEYVFISEYFEYLRYDYKSKNQAIMALGNALSSNTIGIVSGIFAFLAVIVIFRYMFVKRDNYMIHSFPVNRNTLYVTGIVSAFVVLAIPAVAIGIILTITSILLGAGNVGAIWFLVYTMILSNVFFIGFSALTIMLSGQFVTATFFYLILNVVFCGMDLVFRTIEAAIGFGLGNVRNEIEINCLTPTYYICENCGISFTEEWDAAYSKVIAQKIETIGGTTITLYALVGIAFAAFAYYLYKIKSLETVNEFINAPGVKVIFTVGMSFFISLFSAATTIEIFMNTSDMMVNHALFLIILFAIIYGIVVFFVIQMLIDKTVRVFTKHYWTLCGIYTLCAVLVVLMIRFDAFGFESYVPESEKVVEAYISGNYTFAFSDAEDIEKVIEIHKAIINDKKEIQDMNYLDDNRGLSYDIQYRLSSGKVVKRRYYLEEVLENSSSEYVKILDEMDSFLGEPEVIKKHILCSDYKDAKIKDVSFTTYKYDKEILGFRSEDIILDSKYDSEEMCKDLYEAILKDIDAGALFYATPGTDGFDSQQNYYNDLNFTLVSPNKFVEDESLFYGWNDTPQTEKYMYLLFNKNAKNVIEVLKKYEYVKDESDLVTYEQINAYEDEAYYTEEEAVED